MDKSALLNAFITTLQAEMEVLVRAAMMARDEATNEESKAENKYDTHGQEAAYLAESQAKLAADIQASIALYQALPIRMFAPHDSIDTGAVVGLEANGKSQFFFLGPKKGGLEMEFEGQPITLITPQSPLGQQLLGKRVDQTVFLPGRNGPMPHRVFSIE